jgi:hypothetical protein
VVVATPVERVDTFELATEDAPGEEEPAIRNRVDEEVPPGGGEDCRAATGGENLVPEITEHGILLA